MYLPGKTRAFPTVFIVSLGSLSYHLHPSFRSLGEYFPGRETRAGARSGALWPYARDARSRDIRCTRQSYSVRIGFAKDSRGASLKGKRKERGRSAPSGAGGGGRSGVAGGACAASFCLEPSPEPTSAAAHGGAKAAGFLYRSETRGGSGTGMPAVTQ